MTPLETQKQQVRGMIYNLREKLDDIMYGEENIPEEEYKKLRECYDLICKANDKLL